MIINTFRGPWNKGRTSGWVTANDTALTVTTRDWNQISTEAVELPIGTNGLISAFIGGATDAGDPDGDTFTCKIYCYSERGWGELVYDVDCTVGKLQALHLPDGTSLTANGGKFVGTMSSGSVNNSTQWLTDVGLADYGGNDGLSVLAFDALGAYYVYYEISALTANLKVYPVFRSY